MEIAKYVNDFRRWIQSFFTKKQSISVTTENCVLILSEDKISIIHINFVQETLEILFAETFHYEDYDSLELMLSGIVQKNQLDLVPAYWLLTPEDYQLFLIESLPVEKNEFMEALKWRLRSLINYPIEDAVIDSFMLPPKKSTPNSSMVAAITSRFNQLLKVIEILKKCGMQLTIIDIPELALRNLTALKENDEKSSAFIYFYDKLALLNISCQKTLYFTRNINLLTEEGVHKTYEAIALDILRYFDYFQSQWRYPSPTRIFVGSENKNLEEIIKALSEHLLTTVEAYPLKNLLLSQTKITDLDQYVLLLGCGLRKEVENVTTGS